ncbi:hypothetical protein OG943_10085 [Amycolatopsis sp. NBC_00345]|uniref:hypothetical protein n=1 Tax=Amycolatopsis sp. NBC_00345 TaxID=2975955 RepID=UPI002E26027C
MKRTLKAILAAALALVPMVTVTSGTAAARGAGECTWIQAALPLPAGQSRGYVSAAANGGWVAGSGSSSAIRWHNGVAEDLGRAFGEQTDLNDINSAGTAVGVTYANSFEDDAVVYRDGRFTALPIPPGHRTARALAVNDAGDIVGTALGIGDNFDLTIWPAAAPGTVLTINPDPTVYGYVSPVEIDEQGRILIRAESSQADYFVRYPDGTMTKLALGTDYVSAFRNGRIAGEKYEDDRFVTAEWDLTGTVVRRLDAWATEPAVDSGTRTTGTYRTAGGGYALGVWESEALTDTLVTSPDSGGFGGPVITDDGVIATTIGSTAATFSHSCPA